MGRKRLELKYVDCDKKRNTIYEKRKKGLKKKAYELSTLCDVPVCVVIYKGPNSEPETFPSNNEEVLSLLNRYSSIPVDQRYPKKRKSESETTAAVYPTWLPALDACGIDDFVGFYSFLDNKLGVVAQKIQMLRPDFGGNLMITDNTAAAAAAGGDASYSDANFASYGGNLMITNNSNAEEGDASYYDADLGGNLMITNNSNAEDGDASYNDADFGSYGGNLVITNKSNAEGDASYNDAVFGGNLMSSNNSTAGGDASYYGGNFASYEGIMMSSNNSSVCGDASYNDADFGSYGGNLVITNKSNAEEGDASYYDADFGSYQGIVMSSNNSSVCGDASYDDCEVMQLGSGMDGAGWSYDPSLCYDMMSTGVSESTQGVFVDNVAFSGAYLASQPLPDLYNAIVGSEWQVVFLFLARILRCQRRQNY